MLVCPTPSTIQYMSQYVKIYNIDPKFNKTLRTLTQRGFLLYLLRGFDCFVVVLSPYTPGTLFVPLSTQPQSNQQVQLVPCNIITLTTAFPDRKPFFKKKKTILFLPRAQELHPDPDAQEPSL